MDLRKLELDWLNRSRVFGIRCFRSGAEYSGFWTALCAKSMDCEGRDALTLFVGVEHVLFCFLESCVLVVLICMDLLHG